MIIHIPLRLCLYVSVILFDIHFVQDMVIYSNVSGFVKISASVSGLFAFPSRSACPCSMSLLWNMILVMQLRAIVPVN
jgi:hypothetical protein